MQPATNHAGMKVLLVQNQTTPTNASDNQAVDKAPNPNLADYDQSGYSMADYQPQDDHYYGHQFYDQNYPLSDENYYGYPDHNYYGQGYGDVL